MEYQRRDFLINRDGLEKTIKFYRQAVYCYRVASRMALEPREENEVRVCARGREWAEKYRKSQTECLQILFNLRVDNV